MARLKKHSFFAVLEKLLEVQYKCCWTKEKSCALNNFRTSIFISDHICIFNTSLLSWIVSVKSWLSSFVAITRAFVSCSFLFHFPMQKSSVYSTGWWFACWTILWWNFEKVPIFFRTGHAQKSRFQAIESWNTNQDQELQVGDGIEIFPCHILLWYPQASHFQSNLVRISYLYSCRLSGSCHPP